MRLRLLCSTVLSLGVALPAAAQAHPAGPVDLGTLGGPAGEALDLTRPGLVVGAADTTNGTRRAVRWVRGRIEALGTPGPLGSEALDVNASGVIVGAYGLQGSEAERHTQRAFVWRRGRVTTLPGLPGGEGTSARRINNRGVVAGTAIGPDDREHAVTWSHGVLSELPTPPGYDGSYALGVNEGREVVGGAFDEESGAAVRWRGGVPEVLATLGGPSAQANVIDARGRAAGLADTAREGVTEATVWNPQGRPVGLGFLPGGTFSFALGGNGRGDYVGIANLFGDSRDHVFVSRNGGRMRTLPTLTGEATAETKAHGIDARGNVAGSSTDARGRKRPVLWRHAFARSS